MKSKLKYLIGVSFKRKTNTKWFKVVNILLALAIVAIANIDSIINFFGGDFSEKQKIFVVDNTKVSYDLFKSQMMLSTNAKDEEELKYEIVLSDKTEEEANELAKENDSDLVIVFNNDEENVLDVKLISKSYLDILDNQYLENAVYNTKVMLAISKSNITTEQLELIYSKANVERIILDDDKSSTNEKMEVIMTTVFPVIILPFFMLVIFLVQMIGAEVNDEKTTRGMEIIISSVSPSTHFFSKVIASNLFIIMQGALLLVYGLIGFIVRKYIGGDAVTDGMLSSIIDMVKNALNTEFIDKLAYILPLTLVLMILTFLAYSITAGVLASMTTTPEDFQQIQTPIMIVLLIGYYLAILAGTFKGALFIKILSYIPFISAILSPSLLVLGQIGIFDVCISIVIMIVTNYLLIKYGLRIYKVGILNYSSNKLWQKIFKALK